MTVGGNVAGLRRKIGSVDTRAAGVAVVGCAVYAALALIAEIGEDEPGFADVARTAAAGRGFSSPLFTGVLPGAEQRVMWQPPGYYVVLAGWFRVFGFGLIQGRVLSAVAVAVALALAFALARRHAPTWCALVATAVAGASPWVLRAATLIRPDAVALPLIVGAVLAALRWDERPCPRRATLVVACSAGALLMHPLGLIAPVAVGAYLLVRRRWAASVAMPLAAVAIAAACWGLYVAPYPAVFVEQMRLQGARKAGTDVLALLNSQDRWRKLAYAPLLAAGVVLVLRHARLPIAPTLLTGVAVVAATYGGEEVYPVYVVVVAVPLIAVALSYVPEFGRLARLALVAAVGFSLIAGGLLVTRSVSDLGSSAALAAAVGPRAYLGQEAGGVYFAATDTSDLRMAVPVPVPTTFVAATVADRGVAAAVDEAALTRWTGPLPLERIAEVEGRVLWRVRSTGRAP